MHRGIGKARKLVLSVAAAALLAVPASASALAIRDYEGTFFNATQEPVGKVKFEMWRNDQGVRKIAHWTWRRLPLVCKEGDRLHDGYFRKPWPRVKARTFRQRAEDEKNPDNYAVVSGSFLETWARGEGTFRVTGDTYVGKNCESGEVHWQADRLPRTTTG